MTIGYTTFTSWGGSGNAWFVDSFSRVAANKLYDRNRGVIVELTAASKNEIELCEYSLFETCFESNKKVYTKGIQVKVTAGATVKLAYSGYGMGVLYTAEPIFSNAFMLPKGRGTTIKIYSSQANRSIQSVTGCDGTLSGSDYSMPARNTDCEISVTFTSVP